MPFLNLGKALLSISFHFFTSFLLYLLKSGWQKNQKIEEKNIKELDKVKAELQENLNSKHEVELEKKSIEIDKLKNIINQLKEKNNIKK